MSYPKNIHQKYHAHIYFDQQSCELARQIREQAMNRFELPVGRFNEKLVGPHTMWSFSITFTSSEFESVVSWLDNVRNGLSILVHALTGDDIKDHSEYAYWLGKPVELDLSGL
ncbi:DOPA 4,5-dioxygenase family protein [Vibrio sp. VPAP30]|uniref:DOPA 4,5-dioxygenase family protein n=1 Tax=Vibrio sp. VPAP30 TaxID=1647102 RepID=UPI000658017A|nr:DOPA 4,5-dioxygenase family protein [Vibrio sp. VPAP30]KLN64846.1 4,5-dioxygenase [Vibrio sp. VPAP30]